MTRPKTKLLSRPTLRDFKRFRNAFLTVVWLCPVLAVGRERITLNTGFSLDADSHQQVGSTLYLTTSAGSLELLAQDVVSIEVLPNTDASSCSPAASAKPGKQSEISDVLGEAARQQGLPADLVNSVAMAESGLNVRARSPKGAVGLMQLMPGTAKSLGVLATDVDGNARGGAQYLRTLLERYRGNAALALAAYNSGPGTVAKFGGIPPFPETQAYIQRVLRLYELQTKESSAHSAAHRDQAVRTR